MVTWVHECLGTPGGAHGWSVEHLDSCKIDQGRQGFFRCTKYFSGEVSSLRDSKGQRRTACLRKPWMRRLIWRSHSVIWPATATNQAPTELGVTLFFPVSVLIRWTGAIQSGSSRHLGSHVKFWGEMVDHVQGQGWRGIRLAPQSCSSIYSYIKGGKAGVSVKAACSEIAAITAAPRVGWTSIEWPREEQRTSKPNMAGVTLCTSHFLHTLSARIWGKRIRIYSFWGRTCLLASTLQA